MTERRRYRKKSGTFVIGICLDLDTDGFSYHKWGSLQTCRAGDWIVNNDGDIYTVAHDVFERSYRLKSPGVYIKVTHIYAEQAQEPGSIETREGRTVYRAGDYLVANETGDEWAVPRDKFEAMYEPE